MWTLCPSLTASSAALRAQVTKLSLLAITTPFTPSAVVTILRACNESVLPSLLTAALLVTPTAYTKAFHLEVWHLVKTTLAEYSNLVQAVKSISGKKEQAKQNEPAKKEKDLPQSDKNEVTVATGRVWDSCDMVTQIAANGVVGFIASRVEQWRDLVKDAVQELEEWDPAEDEEDFFDDILGEDKGDDEKDGDSDGGSDDEESTAALQEQKKTVLRFLKPVAQVYPAINIHRLKNTKNIPLSSGERVDKLEKLMTYLQRIPDQLDEAAGGLYEEDMDRCIKFLRKIRVNATKAVELVTQPWSSDAAGDNKAEDKFTTWSRTWLKVMDEVSKSFEPDTKEAAK
ncbi:hypothetical protein N7470_007085 [Penicillium chermesinum]|nr:hypothetical protein N7470_007085 [Penicillium chermesinum]